VKGVDTKALLCALYSLTQPREGMRGAMKGVANRRRIWEACEVLGEVYAEAVVALPDLLKSARTLSETVHTFKEEDYYYPLGAVDGVNLEGETPHLDVAVCMYIWMDGHLLDKQVMALSHRLS
jgi:hypothetical protein